MSKKLIKDNEFEKISGGSLRGINKGVDYLSAGIECAVGLAALGICVHNKIKGYKSEGWGDFSAVFLSLFDDIAGTVGAVLALDGTRRIVSQAKGWY